MAKVVFRKLQGPKARGTGTVTVRPGHAGRPAGGRTVLALDTDLETFGDSLTLTFRKNVEKARRENKRVTGSVDRVPAKP